MTGRTGLVEKGPGRTGLVGKGKGRTGLVEKGTGRERCEVEKEGEGK